jgi:hypothetical protein
VTPSIALAKYTRDLLEQPEGVVVLSRSNMPRPDTAALQIAIDQLATATPKSDSQRFDAETLHVGQLWQAVMTIDFYGAEAYNQAIKFITLNRSQRGEDLKMTLGVDIGIVSGLKDLGLLQGEQYSERYQIEVSIMFNVTAAIATRRIDTAEFSNFLVD